jgi:hypothetical protein
MRVQRLRGQTLRNLGNCKTIIIQKPFYLPLRHINDNPHDIIHRDVNIILLLLSFYIDGAGVGIEAYAALFIHRIVINEVVFYNDTDSDVWKSQTFHPYFKIRLLIC